VSEVSDGVICDDTVTDRDWASKQLEQTKMRVLTSSPDDRVRSNRKAPNRRCYNMPKHNPTGPDIRFECGELKAHVRKRLVDPYGRILCHSISCDIASLHNKTALSGVPPNARVAWALAPNGSDLTPSRWRRSRKLDPQVVSETVASG
jgi:hypothetical protein